MVVRDEAIRLKNGEQAETMEGVSEESRARSFNQSLRVMIVDDEPIVGKRLRPALEKHGFEVETFLDPSKALARLQEQEFDIVVTDFRMEELDGIQVLTHVMEKCPNTRVILITGYATVEVAREALVKGAFDFIAKPFKPKDLRGVINKAALSLGHRGIL
jgi:DNA-binding NtrC family response regulator